MTDRILKISTFCLSLIIAFSLTSEVFAQSEAKELIRKVQHELSSQKTVEMQYIVKYFFPDQEPVIEDGLYLKSGDKMMLDVGNTQIYALQDGVFEYNKVENVITIKDRSASGNNFLNPESLLKQFVEGKYDYSISPTSTDSKTNIVFTPLDKNSTYTKLRLTIQNNTTLPQSFFIGMRDGTRIIMDVVEIKRGHQIDDVKFTFDPKSYPNAELEDLRF